VGGRSGLRPARDPDPTDESLQVTSTDDSGEGSLRWAISHAQQGEHADQKDQIEITVSGTLSVQSALPTITEPVQIETVDGAVFEVTNGGGVADGFTVEGSGVLILGLSITGFEEWGIDSEGSRNVYCENEIGLEPDGQTSGPNGAGGIRVDGRVNEICENVISANEGPGLLAKGAEHGILINQIGTNADGNEDRGNEGPGVDLQASSSTVSRNTISANGGDGVWIHGAGTTENRLVENFIGTTESGEDGLGNGGAGIRLGGQASDNRLGTPEESGRGNLISENVTGIRIEGGETTGNYVQNNSIGTTADGTGSLGNETMGIEIAAGASSNFVGTDGDGSDDAGEGNLISGNGQAGAFLAGPGTTNNVVAGNVVGTDANEEAALSNATEGVVVAGRASSNRIGTDGDGDSDAEEGNVISGNGEEGVLITGPGTTGNTVAGNRIGTGSEGEQIANGKDGILVLEGASSTRIGTNGEGNAGSEENLISGNGGNGVRIVGEETSNTVVAGNLIGAVPGENDAFAPLSNEKNGVRIEGEASENRIGSDGDEDSDAAEGNVIAFNGVGIDPQVQGHGVVIASGTKNRISRNSIFENEGRAVDLGDDSFTINDAEMVGGSSQADTDDGANQLQNYLELLRVNFSGAQPQLTWELNTDETNANFELEFYDNDEVDPSGFGEGKDFLESQSQTVTTDGNGRRQVTIQFPAGIANRDVLISAIAIDPDGNTSEFSIIDTDADALADAWELDEDGDNQGDNPIDVNEDGTGKLTLGVWGGQDAGGNAVGPDPRHRDVYVEVDALQGCAAHGDGDGSCAPQGGVLSNVRNAFLNAPNSLVQNPDGNDGVRLHVQLDNGNLSGGLDGPNNALDGGVGGAEFANVHNTHFGPGQGSPGFRARELTFRYGLFADKIFSGRSTVSGTSTVVTNRNFTFGGSDFIVSLGHANWTGAVGWAGGRSNVTQANFEAGTFMHELGHTLGLLHGGGNNVLFKPNYHSVMNYTWQAPDLVWSPGWAGSYSGSWQLWYSRQGVNLNENNLNENNGIGLPGRHGGHQVPIGPRPPGTAACGANFAPARGNPVQLVSETNNADFNGSGVAGDVGGIGSPRNVNFLGDANSDGATTCGDQNDARGNRHSNLQGQNDWAALRFNPRSSPRSFAQGAGTATEPMLASASAAFPSNPRALQQAPDTTEPQEYSLRVKLDLAANDHGDAPDSLGYPTLFDRSGPIHPISDLFLGDTVDADPDGQPHREALGDDEDVQGNDDDGVVGIEEVEAGQTAQLTVTASKAGRLDAFVDFNADGDWAEDGEKIFDDQPLEAGESELSFFVPEDAEAGETFARFRLSSEGELGPGGVTSEGTLTNGVWATGGEVEDYHVQINETNSPPEGVESILDLTLETPGPPLQLTNLEGTVFTDPDGDALGFSASSTASSVVEVVKEGPEDVALRPEAEGTADITVTATDGQAETTADSFEVVVEKRPEGEEVPKEAALGMVPVADSAKVSLGTTAVTTAFRDVQADGTLGTVEATFFSGQEGSESKSDSTQTAFDPAEEFENVSRYRWEISSREMEFDSAEVVFSLADEDVVGIDAPSEVTVIRDAEGDGDFETVKTTYDADRDALVAEGISSFSIFRFASDAGENPLPVDMADFRATTTETGVRLTWQTASEKNNAGFEVQRRAASEPDAHWREIGFVESNVPSGTTNEPQSYRFEDEDLSFAADKLKYRLRQMDLDGTSELTDPVEIERAVERPELRSILPNPARTQVTVRFAVPERQDVALELYDVLGRQVRTVSDGQVQGRQELQVDLSGLASGTYFLRLRAESESKTRRLSVLR